MPAWARALVLGALLAACGGQTGASEGERATEPPAAAEASGEATLAGPLENGQAMPPAARAGGIPPYPGAVVWMRLPRPASEFRVLEAFTPDSFLQVVAYYDSALSGWRRTVAKDAVHYHRDPDLATLIVAPWEGWTVAEGEPAPLRAARTSIGLAWKEGS